MTSERAHVGPSTAANVNAIAIGAAVEKGASRYRDPTTATYQRLHGDFAEAAD